MIIDASALVSLLLDEPRADWVSRQIEANGPPLRMSWVNLIEAAIACERGGAGASRVAFESVTTLGLELLNLDQQVAALVARSRRRLPLNFGDCFAYAHARLLDEPLLTLDADFLKTDLREVLHPDRA